MLNELEKKLCNCLSANGLKLSFIEDNNFGDVTTNIAMINAKKEAVSPSELAAKYVGIFESDKSLTNIFEKIMVAGPGFINFTFSNKYLEDNFDLDIIKIKNKIKSGSPHNNKDVLVEYTDPNPFKIFHIGHLMTNIIGEFIANSFETLGANVKRINYQGDVGRHISINIYAILKSIKDDSSAWENIKLEKDIKTKVVWLGKMYAEGNNDFETDNNNESLSKENKLVVKSVEDINKKIYEKSDAEINEIYDLGKAWSLEYFETLYKLLGTKFDKYIFESTAAPFGLILVKENMGKIFEVGEEGAIIYDGEKDGLHKRVFINKNGLPTYEAKDLGNMQIKLQTYPKISKSVVITGSEQNDYFKVLYKTIEKLFPNTENKLIHFGHGMMRFADGKMSSRKGNVIAGDELIESIKESLQEKFESSRIKSESEKSFLLEKVAIASIKYSVLKQAIGKDIIFDMEKATKVDGDSGPYLQYTHARIATILSKQSSFSNFLSKISGKRIKITDNNKKLILELINFENVLLETVTDIAPQKMITYLINLSHAFNTFYAKEKINGNRDNVKLAKNILSVLDEGLNLLGIYAPREM